MKCSNPNNSVSSNWENPSSTTCSNNSKPHSEYKNNSNSNKHSKKAKKTSNTSKSTVKKESAHNIFEQKPTVKEKNSFQSVLECQLVKKKEDFPLLNNSSRVSTKSRKNLSLESTLAKSIISSTLWSQNPIICNSEKKRPHLKTISLRISPDKHTPKILSTDQKMSQCR